MQFWQLSKKHQAARKTFFSVNVYFTFVIAIILLAAVKICSLRNSDSCQITQTSILTLLSESWVTNSNYKLFFVILVHSDLINATRKINLTNLRLLYFWQLSNNWQTVKTIFLCECAIYPYRCYNTLIAVKILALCNYQIIRYLFFSNTLSVNVCNRQNKFDKLKNLFTGFDSCV